MTRAPYLNDGDIIVYSGDCIEVMRKLPEASVDAIVTDPPYELGFMGKTWDATGIAYQNDTWAAALRLLKPGGHLLAFSGTRTYHRMTCAIEDAGFEIRDCIAWMYGSGFPKSLDVSKAIDKLDATEERTRRARAFQTWLRQHITPQQINSITATDMGHHLTTHPTQPFVATVEMLEQLRPYLPTIPADILQIVHDRSVESENFKSREVTATRIVPKRPGFAGDRYGNPEGVDHNDTRAHTEDAVTWQGWGTALKPAFEPVVVARKPLTGTVAANVLQHGTGALNINATRISATDDAYAQNFSGARGHDQNRTRTAKYGMTAGTTPAAGRWPANVVLDETAANMLDQQSGHLTSGANPTRRGKDNERATYGAFTGQAECEAPRGTDTGGASRFFYTAKASRQDRNVGGLANNTHPTVKPTELMRWLIRLVTPPGGTILDPFGGSGSTGLAARAENVRCILIEREPEYLQIISDRLAQQTLLTPDAAA